MEENKLPQERPAKEQQEKKETARRVHKGFLLAMGLAVIALPLMGVMGLQGLLAVLGIGMACAGVAFQSDGTDDFGK